MPKALIAKITSSEMAAGHSAKKAESIAYGTMNNRGYMRGPNITPKGVKVEQKFRADHPSYAEKVRAPEVRTGTSAERVRTPSVRVKGAHPGRNLGKFLHPKRGF